jgi:NDP-sugar pyrophosphorylase family protein
MKVFIPAAGLGTRLGPLTRDKPKALVEFNGMPMLGGLIRRLKAQGFDRFCVNIHHFGDQVLDYLQKNDFFGVDLVISDEREQLLDTGGAVKKAGSFFEGTESVLVHNVDVYTDLDYHKIVKEHERSGALVSLLVRKRNSTRKLLFDEHLALKGWKNLTTGEYKWSSGPVTNYTERAFSGIYVASPDFPLKIKSNGKFPVVPVWLDLVKDHIIKGVDHSQSLWFDLGTPEKIKEAERTSNQ